MGMLRGGGARVDGASREARRPIIAPYRNGTGKRGMATGHGRGGAGCQAAHRAKARRRDGDIAPYRQAARGWCATGRGMPSRTRVGHGNGARDAKPRTAVASRHGQ